MDVSRVALDSMKTPAAIMILISSPTFTIGWKHLLRGEKCSYAAANS
jgi:hypothetical protein